MKCHEKEHIYYNWIKNSFLTCANDLLQYYNNNNSTLWISQNINYGIFCSNHVAYRDTEIKSTSAMVRNTYRTSIRYQSVGSYGEMAEDDRCQASWWPVLDRTVRLFNTVQALDKGFKWRSAIVRISVSPENVFTIFVTIYMCSGCMCLVIFL